MAVIRRMRETDTGQASELEADNFSDGWTEHDFEETLRLDYAYYYVAEEGGRLIGICGLRNIAGEGEITNVSGGHPLSAKRGGIGLAGTYPSGRREAGHSGFYAGGAHQQCSRHKVVREIWFPGRGGPQGLL